MARGRWPPGSSWIFYFNTIEAPEAGGCATGDGGDRETGNIWETGDTGDTWEKGDTGLTRPTVLRH